MAPDAPLMRPSVTSATAYPRFWRTPSEGVSACSSGIPLADGPCSRITTIDVAVELAPRERLEEADLVGEDAGRRLDDPVLVRDRGHLDDRVAQRATEDPQPTVDRERVVGRAQDGRVAGFRCGVDELEPTVDDASDAGCSAAARVPRPSARPRAAARGRAGCGSRKGVPPAAWKWFTSAGPLG